VRVFIHYGKDKIELSEGMKGYDHCIKSTTLKSTGTAPGKYALITKGTTDRTVWPSATALRQEHWLTLVQTVFTEC